jgi:hypothetical protein
VNCNVGRPAGRKLNHGAIVQDIGCTESRQRLAQEFRTKESRRLCRRPDAADDGRKCRHVIGPPVSELLVQRLAQGGAQYNLDRTRIGHGRDLVPPDAQLRETCDARLTGF